MFGKNSETKKKEKEEYVYGRNSYIKDLWYFIWEDNSFWSWIVNIILAFVLIKFIVYPLLGFFLGTSFPIVAVISGSMDHDLSGNNICGKFPLNYRGNFDGYWSACGSWYEERGITKDEFSSFKLSNGFNKGDIIVLYGKDEIEVGDILVFWAQNPSIKRDPIIHRVIEIKDSADGKIYTTKGDHNPGSIQDNVINEASITEDRVIGTALFKIPLLGYIKIIAVSIMSAVFGLFY